MRRILPVAVILKRFLAPRCVLSFNLGFVEFHGIALNPLRPLLRAELVQPVLKSFGGKTAGVKTGPYFSYAFVCAAVLLRGATLAPFFGAKSATRTLPSMRGIVSIWQCSPISPRRRVILARPTSWCAISRPR